MNTQPEKPSPGLKVVAEIAGKAIDRIPEEQSAEMAAKAAVLIRNKVPAINEWWKAKSQEEKRLYFSTSWWDLAKGMAWPPQQMQNIKNENIAAVMSILIQMGAVDESEDFITEVQGIYRGNEKVVTYGLQGLSVILPEVAPFIAPLKLIVAGNEKGRRIGARTRVMVAEDGFHESIAEATPNEVVDFHSSERKEAA